MPSKRKIDKQREGVSWGYKKDSKRGYRSTKVGVVGRRKQTGPTSISIEIRRLRGRDDNTSAARALKESLTHSPYTLLRCQGQTEDKKDRRREGQYPEKSVITRFTEKKLPGSATHLVYKRREAEKEQRPT